jgi:hypothetical protein
LEPVSLLFLPKVLFLQLIRLGLGCSHLCVCFFPKSLGPSGLGLDLFDLPGEPRRAGLVRDFVPLEPPEGEELAFPVHQLQGSGEEKGVVGLIVTLEGGHEGFEPFHLLSTVVDAGLQGVGSPFFSDPVVLFFTL